MKAGVAPVPGDVDLIDVLVVYAPAPPELPLRQQLRLQASSTVADALRAASSVVDVYRAQIDDMQICVFGERCELTTPLRDGDRVELLRPLQRSPTEQRRARHAQKRTPENR